MESIAIAGIIAVAAILLAVYWPVQTALGMYALLLPFDTVLGAGKMGTVRFHVTWFVGLAGACILLLTGLQGRGFVRAPKPAGWLILFVIWCGTTALWAIYPGNVAFRMPLIVVLLLLYLAGVCLPITTKELTAVAWISILGACIASVMCLHSFYQGNFWYPEGVEHQDELVGRATLIISESVTDPNIFSASLILPLSLALGLLFSSRSWLSKTLLLAALGLIWTTIFFTGSRGGLLATIGVLVVFLVSSRVRWKLIVPLVVLACVMVAAPGFFLTRISQTMEDRGAGRIDIWKVGLEAFKHYGVLGAGLDSFPPAYNKYAYIAFDFKGYDRGSHNVYLGVATELGVVGLALLLTFAATNLVAAAHVTRRENNNAYHVRLVSHMAACWGLLVCGFFLDIEWDPYFWLVWTILAAGLRAPLVSDIGNAGERSVAELQPTSSEPCEV